jgi:hypothetical protein
MFDLLLDDDVPSASRDQERFSTQAQKAPLKNIKNIFQYNIDMVTRAITVYDNVKNIICT